MAHIHSAKSAYRRAKFESYQTAYTKQPIALIRQPDVHNQTNLKERNGKGPDTNQTRRWGGAIVICNI